MSNEQGPQVTITAERVEIASLRKHPRNYRAHPPAQLEHIGSMLQQVGLYRNIVVAQDGTILAGHGVVEAATKIGWTHIDVRRLSIAPMSALALKVLTADNELGRFADDDDRALTELLKEVRETDPLALLGTGYDDKMLAGLLMVTRPAAEIQGISEASHWLGMPEYDESSGDLFQLVITFESEEARSEYVRAKGIDIIKKQRLAWSARWPNSKREDAHSVRFKKSGHAPSTPPPAADEQPAPRRRKKAPTEVSQ